MIIKTHDDIDNAYNQAMQRRLNPPAPDQSAVIAQLIAARGGQPQPGSVPQNTNQGVV